METSSFDLLYLERDPSTKEPAACVRVKVNAGHDCGGIGVDKMITAPCLSFIELDAEIRRLQTELGNPLASEEEVLSSKSFRARFQTTLTGSGEFSEVGVPTLAILGFPRFPTMAMR